MMNSIQFGSKKIEFELIYTQRKTLGITVTPEMQVLVKAPVNASLAKIKERIVKRAPWILKQQNYFLSFHPKTPPRKFTSGESHFFLGRQYKLIVTKSKKSSVSYKGRIIEVEASNKTQTQKLVNQWYKTHAKKIFSDLAEPIIQKFKKYKVEPSGIYIQSMKKRWGSCTPKGKIILNPELVKAPKKCIEYVIIHEMCHLVHPDHSAKFFELQSKEMPDWRKWKNKLERIN